MHSAWQKPHELTDDACPECQGSCYVPALVYGDRLVDKCPKCEGTGKDQTKRAA